ncbi:MAG: hypothetical protein KGD60_12095 [Candidatus Thorarchaeota archaeon]|nr:hypothetical protein [Candidatus Thorarchaeota archaeon]
MRKRELSSVTFLVLFLLPIFVQAFSIDRDLGAGEFYAAYRDASTGWRIEGSFSASNDIEFFICDEDNYTRWKRQESAKLHEHSEDTPGQTFNFTIPYDSVWYVVFFNVQSNFVTSLDAEFYYFDQSDIVQTQVSWITQSTIIGPLFIGVLVAVPVVCLLVIWISRRGERFPAVRYEKILPKPD